MRMIISLWIFLLLLGDFPTPTHAFIKQWWQKATGGSISSGSSTSSSSSSSSTGSSSSSSSSEPTNNNDDDDTAFTFTQELLHLTHQAVHLSNIAYDEDPFSSTWKFQYTSMDVYNEDVDQAVLVKTTDPENNNDYCMVAFRGTDLSSWYDIYQNIMLGNTPVCSSGSSSSDSNVCCNAEDGFYNAYNRGYRIELENKIRFCASQCQPIMTTTETTTKCPTVVLTGHSQGGSIATIAAIVLSDLSPIVITFGQPPTIDTNCPLLKDNHRTYRFENSRIGRRGTTYDPVPYLPYRDNQQYGHQIMLGDDTTRVAYIGHSSTTKTSTGSVEFEPWDSENFFATHRLTSNTVGYLDRIDALVQANINTNTDTNGVIPSSGFLDETACSNGLECDSKICFTERCVRA